VLGRDGSSTPLFANKLLTRAAERAGCATIRWGNHCRASAWNNAGIWQVIACVSQLIAGDAANVILSAVEYNLRLVLAWLRMILHVVLLALLQAFAIRPYQPDF
jgi:hypothetical protein